MPALFCEGGLALAHVHWRCSLAVHGAGWRQNHVQAHFSRPLERGRARHRKPRARLRPKRREPVCRLRRASAKRPLEQRCDDRPCETSCRSAASRPLFLASKPNIFGRDNPQEGLPQKMATLSAENGYPFLQVNVRHEHLRTEFSMRTSVTKKPLVYRLPLLGPIAREWAEGDPSFPFFFILASVTAWAILWGLPALVLPALALVPLLFVLIVLLTRG